MTPSAVKSKEGACEHTLCVVNLKFNVRFSEYQHFAGFRRLNHNMQYPCEE